MWVSFQYGGTYKAGFSFEASITSFPAFWWFFSINLWCKCLQFCQMSSTTLTFLFLGTNAQVLNIKRDVSPASLWNLCICTVYICRKMSRSKCMWFLQLYLQRADWALETALHIWLIYRPFLPRVPIRPWLDITDSLMMVQPCPRSHRAQKIDCTRPPCPRLISANDTRVVKFSSLSIYQFKVGSV